MKHSEPRVIRLWKRLWCLWLTAFLSTCFRQIPAGRALAASPPAHGVIDTPRSCRSVTQGTVKALNAADAEEAGASIILGNTYHLYLRPGHSIINQLGRLAPVYCLGAPDFDR